VRRADETSKLGGVTDRIRSRQRRSHELILGAVAHPEGPGSVSGAPNLLPGFAATVMTRSGASHRHDRPHRVASGFPETRQIVRSHFAAW
jgi:hypothetical protein